MRCDDNGERSLPVIWDCATPPAPTEELLGAAAQLSMQREHTRHFVTSPLLRMQPLHPPSSHEIASSAAMSNISTCSSSPSSSELGFLQHENHQHLLLDGANHEDNEWSFMKADGLLPQQSAPPKRATWTRRLVVTKQPVSEFYKDEGTSCLGACYSHAALRSHVDLVCRRQVKLARC